MKKTLAVLLVLMLCVSMLAACGGGADAAALSGKYVISSMEENGTVTDLEEMEAMFEAMGMALADSMYLDFKDGGAFDMMLFGEVVSGTYTEDGNTVTLTTDGEGGMQAAIDGDTITLEEDGTKMVFKK